MTFRGPFFANTSAAASRMADRQIDAADGFGSVWSVRRRRRAQKKVFDSAPPWRSLVAVLAIL